jgi:branched-chain amino acid transport system substrate-binding protein
VTSSPGPFRGRACRSSLALLVLTSLGCGHGAASKPTPSYSGTVRIGVATPLTGDLAGVGTTIADGALLAVEDVNRDGGLLGKKVELVVADDRGSEGGGREAANRLVSAGVVAVVGDDTSEASIASAPLYAQANVVQVTPTSTDPHLTESGLRSLFRVCATSSSTGPALAQALSAAQKSHATFVIEDRDGQEGTLSVLTRRPARAPATIVHVPEDARDLAAAVSETAAARADAAVMLASPTVASRLLTQAQQRHVALPPLFGPPELVSSQFLLSSVAEGTTLTALFPNRVSGQSANTDLVRHYRERFAEDPGYEAPAGYVAAFTYFEGVRNAQSFEAGSVSGVLHSPSFHYDSMIGVISFDSHGDLTEQRLYPQVVKGGRLEPVPHG